jgi:mannitol 2-dehydrogenase
VTRLGRGVVSSLDPRVHVPGYDPSRVTPGIAHIGVGGFHRAHEAVVLDRLLATGHASDWGIVGVGLLPQDATMRDALREQDYLYTVVVKHSDGSREAQVVGSIVDFVLAREDPEPVLSTLVDPRIRIVSLTITEGGYQADQVTGELVVDDALDADLVPGAVPATAFGFLVEALRRRRAAGVAPFTVMSCDNIPGNGTLARRVITSFARLRDPDLANWITATVAFPSSMVDRITPVTTDADHGRLAEDLGVEDAWPVVCEPYLQWVLEDHFPTGRPAFDAAGVQLVDDVAPYERMKLRLLNGSHQALGYLGYLAGHRHVHEAAQDPLFVRFLRGYMAEEAAPTLDPVPGIDLAAYQASVLERFANPHVADTLSRICTDSSDRIPTFLLPVVHDQIARGGLVRHAALVVAAWARYAEGVDEQGRPIDVVDQRRDTIVARAQHTREDPLAFLDDPTLFGDLRDQPAFTSAYVEALQSLHTRGARATLEHWVDDDVSPGAP